MIPQVIYVVLLCINLGVALGKHGQSQKPVNFFVVGIDAILTSSLLYWGGFFDVFFTQTP